MLNSFQKALEIIKENLYVENSLYLNSSKLHLKKNLQHLTLLKSKDKNVDQLLKLINSFASNAELNCAYAGEYFFKYLILDPPKKPEGFKSREDIVSFLQKRLKKTNLEIIKEVLSLASIDTKIFVKKSTTNKTYIEITEGFKFAVQPLTLTETYKVLVDPLILCIDGYIESVAEIHHLLEQISETKKELVLCARGFANDVITTAIVNRNRGTMHVYPVIVPYNLESVNSLVDIATVTGSDVVSSTKGEIIGKDNYKFCRAVDEVVFQQKEMIIKNQINAQRQINNLVKKIEERKDVENFLKSRLESLSSKQLTINLPDDLNFTSNSHEIDLAIRLIIDSSVGKTPEDIAKSYLQSFQNYIKNLEQPTLTI